MLRFLSMVGQVAFSSLVGSPHEPLLASILNATDLGILVTGLDHRALACNDRFGEIFCVNPEEAVSAGVEKLRASVLPIIVEPDRWLRNLDEVYAQPALKYEDELVLRTTEQKHIHRFSGPVYDETGRIAARLWTFRDVHGFALNPSTIAQSTEEPIQVGPISVDQKSRTATVNGQPIGLTNTEFRLLVLLAKRAGEALAREEIFQHIWGYDITCNTNSLEVYMYRLRKKIQPEASSAHILHTIKGFGYKLLPA